MKTVLQILPSLRKINGGVERGALDIAKELAEKKFRSVIISSGGDMAEKYKYKGVDHYTLQIEKRTAKLFFVKGKVPKNFKKNRTRCCSYKKSMASVLFF